MREETRLSCAQPWPMTGDAEAYSDLQHYCMANQIQMLTVRLVGERYHIVLSDTGNPQAFARLKAHLETRYNEVQKAAA